VRQLHRDYIRQLCVLRRSCFSAPESWRDIILTHLKSFVETVHKIRADDDRRYRLLTAVAAADADPVMMETSWEIMFEPFPWLESRDTANHNIRE
jgi:hypothetical protein